MVCDNREFQYFSYYSGAFLSTSFLSTQNAMLPTLPANTYAFLILTSCYLQKRKEGIQSKGKLQ